MGVIDVKCDNCGFSYSADFDPPFNRAISIRPCTRCSQRKLRRDFSAGLQIHEDRSRQPLKRVEIVFDSPEMPL